MKKLLILIICIFSTNTLSAEGVNPCEEICSLVLEYRSDYFDEKKETEELLSYFVPKLRKIFFEEKARGSRFMSTDINKPMDAPILVKNIESIERFNCQDYDFKLLEISPYSHNETKCIEIRGKDRLQREMKVKLIFFDVEASWKIGFFEINSGAMVYSQVINN